MVTLALRLYGWVAIFATSASADPALGPGFSFRGSENVSSSKAQVRTLVSSLSVLQYGGPELLDRVEAEMSAAFQSIPKNDFGRVDWRSTRYLLQMYFARSHGWQLTGLEPHGFVEEVSNVKDLILVREQAPPLAKVLAAASVVPHGLTLREVASVAATLERLVLDQSLNLLQAAYKANRFSMSGALNEKEMEELLCSYLILFELADQVGDHNARTTKFTELEEADGFGFDHIAEFAQEALWNDAFEHHTLKNPLGPAVWKFDDATRVVETLVHGYGEWQNQECTFMSDQLEKSAVDGAFPLDVFFTPEMEELGFRLTETVEYLEETGALDPVTKQVRLPNYISGPSNCIRASRYYSICCMSECDVITQELMDLVQGPAAPPEQIAAAVANMGTRHVDAPRRLSKALLLGLEELAERHDGLVQLHSRLFAQWLHSVFPADCPFPHIIGDTKVMETAYWKDELALTVNDEDRLKRAADLAEHARKQPRLTGSEVMHHWADEEEVFYLEGGRSISRSFLGAWLSIAVRWFPAVALLLAGARQAVVMLRSAKGKPARGALIKSRFRWATGASAGSSSASSASAV